MPIYCCICMCTFDSEEDRDIHTREQSCEQRPVIYWDCVSEAQKKQLQKYSPRSISEEEQWYKIFEILFPDHPRPCSPYLDSELSDEINAFKDFASNEARSVLRERMALEGLSSEMFQASELTAFLETVIADVFETLSERWMALTQRQAPRTAGEGWLEHLEQGNSNTLISPSEHWINGQQTIPFSSDGLGMQEDTLGSMQNPTERGGPYLSEPSHQDLESWMDNLPCFPQHANEEPLQQRLLISNTDNEVSASREDGETVFGLRTGAGTYTDIPLSQPSMPAPFSLYRDSLHSQSATLQ